MLPIRIVVESSRSVWHVSCFAFDLGLIFYSSVEPTDDVPGEVIWVTRDAATMLHRIDDQFAEMTYLLCRGEDAEAVAESAVAELDGLNAETLMLAMRSRDDASLSEPSITALGILAPLTFDPAFFATFQWILDHPSDQVRHAGIRATAYPAWPEFVAELDRLANSDINESNRTAAKRGAALIRSHHGAVP